MPHTVRQGSTFFCFANKPDFNWVSQHDTVVVQRCCTKPQFEFLNTAARLNMKIIYDLDDNVWALPDYNPAREVLHQHRDGFKACIRMVDAVSVSTKTLAHAVRKHVKFMVNARTNKEIPIIITENKIYPSLFAPPRIDERVIVGWAGSSSHIGDLPLIEEAIMINAKEHPEMIVEMRGCPLPESSQIQTLPNYRFGMWMPVAEYASRMPRWGWSIALAPVTDCEFNDAKSCIKAVEAGYCGIPCLMSYVRPYWEFCQHDKELEWLLCSVNTQFTHKLRELLNDPARRIDLGNRAKKVVQEHYTFSPSNDHWESLFNTVKAI